MDCSAESRRNYRLYHFTGLGAAIVVVALLVARGCGYRLVPLRATQAFVDAPYAKTVDRTVLNGTDDSTLETPSTLAPPRLPAARKIWGSHDTL